MTRYLRSSVMPAALYCLLFTMESMAQSMHNSVERFGHTVTAQLTERLHKARPDELLPVTIVMKPQAYSRGAVFALDASGHRQRPTRGQLIERLKATAERTKNILEELREPNTLSVAFERPKFLWIINAVSLSATPHTIAQLSNRADVERVEADPPQHVILDEGWGVAKIGADRLWSNSGLTGFGIIVAIIDTGIDVNHHDLKQRIADAKNFLPSGRSAEDDNGHGTEMAGILAGDGSSGTRTGVAPGVKLMVLKALDSDGNAREGDVWEAIQYAVENGASIINLSIGWTKAQKPDRKSWRQICDTAAAAGVLLVAAAGNEGTLAAPTIRTPADVPNVIAVGAVDDSDVRTSISSEGPVDWTQAGFSEASVVKPDVAAPGKNIRTTVLDGRPPTAYFAFSGTSEAAPHVSGLAAMMMEAASKNHKLLTADKIKACLASTSLHLGVAGKNNDYGSGRIVAPSAVACATQ